MDGRRLVADSERFTADGLRSRLIWNLQSTILNLVAEGRGDVARALREFFIASPELSGITPGIIKNNVVRRARHGLRPPAHGL